jgi:hypothetical protein
VKDSELRGYKAHRGCRLQPDEYRVPSRPGSDTESGSATRVLYVVPTCEHRCPPRCLRHCALFLMSHAVFSFIRAEHGAQLVDLMVLSDP